MPKDSAKAVRWRATQHRLAVSRIVASSWSSAANRLDGPRVAVPPGSRRPARACTARAARVLRSPSGGAHAGIVSDTPFASTPRDQTAVDSTDGLARESRLRSADAAAPHREAARRSDTLVVSAEVGRLPGDRL